MKRKNFIFVFAAVMALGFMSCNNDGKDIVVKETDYTEVFLNAFEEKLSLLFQTAERDLRRGNHNFELLFKNASIEVLGDYADIGVFEDVFWAVSQPRISVRKMSVDEQLFVNLTHEIIDSSATKGEAVVKFDNLANDASLSLENRVNFVSMREFLSFYENNESDIIYIIIENPEDFSEYEIELRRNRFWRCILGVYVSRNAGIAAGCLGGAKLGSYTKKPKVIIGGCLIGGVFGSVTGTIYGINNYCL